MDKSKAKKRQSGDYFLKRTQHRPGIGLESLPACPAAEVRQASKVSLIQ